MGTILGDLFKNVGGGLGKVFDGEILRGLGDVLGGVGGAVGRTVNGALNLVGLGEDEDPAMAFCICSVGCFLHLFRWMPCQDGQGGWPHKPKRSHFPQ